jgi:hypothetical protein
MNTHKVIDTHYSNEEGNIDFIGTFEECQRYIEEQSSLSESSSFMLRIEQLNERERDYYLTEEEEATEPT